MGAARLKSSSRLHPWFSSRGLEHLYCFASSFPRQCFLRASLTQLRPAKPHPSRADFASPLARPGSFASPSSLPKHPHLLLSSLLVPAPHPRADSGLASTSRPPRAISRAGSLRPKTKIYAPDPFVRFAVSSPPRLCVRLLGSKMTYTQRETAELFVENARRRHELGWVMAFAKVR